MRADVVNVRIVGRRPTTHFTTLNVMIGTTLLLAVVAAYLLAFVVVGAITLTRWLVNRLK